MPECIHGFDEGFCDICFPRRAPEPKRVPKPATRAPRAPAVRAPRGTMAARPAGGGPAPFDLAAQRVFHVTHVRNLEAILIDGALRAAATPEVDVSSELARAARVELETPVGTRVAEHVAFYLTPEAERWRELRAIAVGESALTPHWSGAAAAAAPSDFVVLAVPVKTLGAEVVVSDGDAAAEASRFAVGADAGGVLLRQRRSSAHFANPDDTSADLGLREAELLATPTVPVSAIALIGVANEPARDRVRALLAEAWPADAGSAPKVAVYPPWFLAGE